MITDLFAISPQAQASFLAIDGQIPAVALDGVFAEPLAVREAALALDYQPGTAHYPGRVARFPQNDPSLTAFLRKIITLVEREFLPQLPVLPDGRRLERVRGLDTDFAITDRHPSELSVEQRTPHVDAVPVFGLVYLNEEERGGTLFFKSKGAAAAAEPGPGYPTTSTNDIEICGRIEGRFNRLSIYPGFILHSGEIAGDWIAGEERFRSPRLTQRIMFHF